MVIEPCSVAKPLPDCPQPENVIVVVATKRATSKTLTELSFICFIFTRGQLFVLDGKMARKPGQAYLGVNTINHDELNGNSPKSNRFAFPLLYNMGCFVNRFLLGLCTEVHIWTNVSFYDGLPFSALLAQILRVSIGCLLFIGSDCCPIQVEGWL